MQSSMLSLLFALAPAFTLVPAPLAATAAGEGTLAIDLSRYEVRGDPSAPVLIVEFSDFKCHACEKFNLTIKPNLEKEFIDEGKVKVIFVDFPLVNEDHYTTVAEAVHCAGSQGKYWAMHDTLWQKIGALSDQHLLGYAGDLGLDVAAFKKCLDEDVFRQRVLDDLDFTYHLGLSSRPSFFIGRQMPGAREGVYEGRYIVGTQNYIVYRAVIDRMLKPPPTGK